MIYHSETKDNDGIQSNVESTCVYGIYMYVVGRIGSTVPLKVHRTNTYVSTIKVLVGETEQSNFKARHRMSRVIRRWGSVLSFNSRLCRLLQVYFFKIKRKKESCRKRRTRKFKIYTCIQNTST